MVLAVVVVTVVAVISTGLIVKLTASGKLLNANVSQRKAESVSQAALEMGIKAVVENNDVFTKPTLYTVDNTITETGMKILVGNNDFADASLTFQALPSKSDIKYIKIISTGNYANEEYKLQRNIEIE